MTRRNPQGQEGTERWYRSNIFGDQQGNKSNSEFRLATINIQGLPRRESHPKMLLFQEWAIQGGYDMICLQEHNGNISNYNSNETPHSMFQNYWKWTNVRAAWLKSGDRAKFQYGGTATITNDRLASCIWKQGRDDKDMGRWTWTSFRGKNNYITTVINIYYPNNSTDAGSVEGQQLKILTEIYKSERRQPQDEFRKDLRTLLDNEFENGHNVVMMGDFNRQVTDERKAIIGLLKSYGMKEAILDRHSESTPPSTRHPGSKQIDGIFVSSRIDIVRGGYIDHEMSDHLALWVDIKDTVFLGQGTEPLVKPQARRLQLKVPSVKNSYNDSLDEELNRRQVLERIQLLQEIVNNGADLRNNKELAEIYERVYECGERSVFFADKRCRKIRGGGIAYSKVTRKAIGEVTVWKLILARVALRGRPNRPHMRYLEQKIKKWKFTHEWQSLTKEEIIIKYRQARAYLRKIKPNSFELRQTYLAQLADEVAAELEDDNVEKHYRRLMREERERRSWRSIGHAQGKNKGGLCSQVEKENEDGTRTLITERTELILEIIRANIAKLQQANNTPLRQEPLRTYFEEDGGNYEACGKR